ncbi:hypothetical protein Bca52824_074179 [Brassica carinata]|uniref:Uncharacterized protein n=1 Tax=Brassica carinata TaxID=52824 RepID=A0A8X7QED4_BRACI|nr:hypothetical protein Bca52824_074179 [Brassica carinata]
MLESPGSSGLLFDYGCVQLWILGEGAPGCVFSDLHLQDFGSDRTCYVLVKMIELRAVVVHNCEHLFDRWVYLRFYARLYVLWFAVGVLSRFGCGIFMCTGLVRQLPKQGQRFHGSSFQSQLVIADPFGLICATIWSSARRCTNFEDPPPFCVGS